MVEWFAYLIDWWAYLVSPVTALGVGYHEQGSLIAITLTRQCLLCEHQNHIHTVAA